MVKEPTISPETLKKEGEMQKYEDRLMSIIEDAQAFTAEEIEALKNFVSDPVVREKFPPEELDKMIETDEKFGATKRILIAARAWLDNKK